MTDTTDAYNGALTEDELSTLGRFILGLESRANWGHYEASTRWRAKCKCGDRWPCPELKFLRDGTKLMEAAISELMYRRVHSRPLNGLERVRLAVQKARGDNSAPPMPRGFA